MHIKNNMLCSVVNQHRAQYNVGLSETRGGVPLNTITVKQTLSSEHAHCSNVNV